MPSRHIQISAIHFEMLGNARDVVEWQHCSLAGRVPTRKENYTDPAFMLLSLRPSCREEGGMRNRQNEEEEGSRPFPNICLHVVVAVPRARHMILVASSLFVVVVEQ